MLDELYLELKDEEWPFDYIDHDRQIARAIVVDKDAFFYFVRVERDDEFGKVTLIETAGGGVEKGEDLLTAVRRELGEELGVEVDILCKIGVVSDYYNLIHRHNINHYFLGVIKSFKERHLTKAELESFHLSVLKLTYQEALSAYESCSGTKLGRLIKRRELGILMQAKKLLERAGYTA